MTHLLRLTWPSARVPLIQFSNGEYLFVHTCVTCVLDVLLFTFMECIVLFQERCFCSHNVVQSDWWSLMVLLRGCRVV